jgi:hypothetical protein
MLKQASYLCALIVALFVIFVVVERTSSPFFQGCISENENYDKKASAKKYPSSFGAVVTTYVRCSGRFIEGHGIGITALATLIIAALTTTLWHATNRLTTISTQQVRYFETAERPWISVTAELRSPLTFKDGRGQIRIALRLLNTGRSPAIGVDIRTVICPISIDAIKELKKLSETKPPYDSWLDEDHDAPGWRRRTFGKTMFPNEPLGVPENLVMQPDEIEAAAKRDRTNFINPAIVGLVTYKFAFSKTEHHTGFIIDLAIAIPEVRAGPGNLHRAISGVSA